jgi:hypothetical protein
MVHVPSARFCLFGKRVSKHLQRGQAAQSPFSTNLTDDTAEEQLAAIGKFHCRSGTA